jgi:hypothetical protein
MAAMACGENPEKGEENDMQYFWGLPHRNGFSIMQGNRAYFLACPSSLLISQMDPCKLVNSYNMSEQIE